MSRRFGSRLRAVGKFVNATATGENSSLFLTVSYDESELGAVDESTHRMWKYDDGDWSRVDGVNTEANYVFANIADFSVFAPLGQNATGGSETPSETESATESTAATETPQNSASETASPTA